jgi:endonuclease/exonuclease/phosphatase family metal-dependent hydrolase
MIKHLHILFFLLLGCEPFALSLEDIADDQPRFVADTLSENEEGKTQFRVMAWNIKYGAKRMPFWFDCWGDQVSISSEQIKENMSALYEMINEANPDILMVEEIELHSRRSAYYDMIQGILNNTDLNYGAYYETWNSRYIPSEGLGRMSLGNAIFSKYPITKSEKIMQADRRDLDPITKPFYLHRAIGRAEIKISNDQSIAAYVVHTSAYDQDGTDDEEGTKVKQIKQIYDVVTAEQLPFILGGDFNELPPTAAKTESFPDERTSAVCGEDFEQPPYTPEVMSQFYEALSPWITLERYGLTEPEQSRYYTHTVLGPDENNELGESVTWNRTLDYLFSSPGAAWVDGSTDVLQHRGQVVGHTDSMEESPLNWTLDNDPLQLSDHAPVFGLWEVSP